MYADLAIRLSEVTIEDESTIEQMKMIQQLDDEDKQTIFKLIDKMLTNKSLKISSLKILRLYRTDCLQYKK